MIKTLVQKRNLKNNYTNFVPYNLIGGLSLDFFIIKNKIAMGCLYGKRF